MDTGTAPKKTGKASPFGIPRRTIIIALTVVILAAVIFFLTAFSPFVTIPAGHTGIVTTFGRVEDYTLSEGFHLKSPLKQVIVMDTRTQRASLSMQAFSSDIQQVDVVCSVNYSVDRETCQKLYQRVGMNYYQNVMEPRVLENVKTVFARYTAENLMDARNTLSQQIMELLAPEMAEYGISVTSVAIENVDFTDAFTDAVEQKQVAEQTRLRVETEQAQQTAVEEAQAERRVIAANAEAEERAILAEADANVARINADAEKYRGEQQAAANEALAASLTEELIAYYQTQQWNGELPAVFGGDTLPILEMGALTEDESAPEEAEDAADEYVYTPAGDGE